MAKHNACNCNGTSSPNVHVIPVLIHPEAMSDHWKKMKAQVLKIQLNYKIEAQQARPPKANPPCSPLRSPAGSGRYAAPIALSLVAPHATTLALGATVRKSSSGQPPPQSAGIDWRSVCTRDHWSASFVTDAFYPWVRLVQLLGSLDDHWQRLILAVFRLPAYPGQTPGEAEYETVWEAFSQVPSSLPYHHAFVHGNLVHTVEVANLALASRTSFLVSHEWEAAHPEAATVKHNKRYGFRCDESTLIGLALLHDVGKSLRYIHKGSVYGRFKTSPWGRSANHHELGYDLVMQALRLTPDFPVSSRKALENFMGPRSSSFGEGDYRFKTQEATLVHRADQMSASQHRHAEVVRGYVNPKPNRSATARWRQYSA